MTIIKSNEENIPAPSKLNLGIWGMNAELCRNLGDMPNRHSRIIISQVKALYSSKTIRKGEQLSLYMTVTFAAYNMNSLKAQVEHFRLVSFARR